MSAQAPTYQDAIAIATRMAQNPADSVSLADQLLKTLVNLPPPRGELLSRPIFERASLWTLACSFENIEPAGEAPPQEILIPHDMWVRGIVAQAYPNITRATETSVLEFNSIFFALNQTIGRNNRALFESNYRIDAKQGFISTGQSEILAPASLIYGDGFWYTPIDWKLQKGQVIEVRVRSRMLQAIPANLIDTNEEAITDADRILRWVVVAFWCEELSQPSIQ